MLARFEEARPRRWTIAVALVLVSPTLVTGFVFDDYVLLYKLAHPGSDVWPGSAPLDLFRWLDPQHYARFIDGAGLAWWTFDHTTIAFMRPVSSLTHALDQWLWPNNAVGMHVQSVLWFALLLGLAAKLYAEMIESRWIAGVACAMFALDSAHGVAVGWISNRNALVGGVFAIATLLLHHRSRSSGERWRPVLAWLCFGMSLLSAELALGVVGYLIAYALFFEAGALGRRLRSLLPYAAISVGWIAWRHAAHYGVYGLGAYVDPMKEPLAFAQGLPSRFSISIASQVWRLSADLSDMLPASFQAVVLGCALALSCVVVWFAWPGLRAERSIRFWAGGAALSVLPLAAGSPSDRLLTLVGLGVMPTLAHAIWAALLAVCPDIPEAQGPAAVLRAACAAWLTLVHLVVDPVLLPALALSLAALAGSAETADEGLSRDPRVRDETVIVAQIPDSMMLTYLPAMRSFKREPRPDKIYWLMATEADVRVERCQPNTLRVSATAGLFARWEERSSRLPLHKGDRVELSEMTVTVVEVSADGRPTVCDFVFARPLESPSYLWLTWHGHRLEPLRLPSEGHSKTLRTTRIST
jgi:hypothetical protein